MEIIHKLHCSKCKIKTNLIPYAKGSRKYGIVQYYVCRKCNAERANNYRKTENGAKKTRSAVYRSIAKHRNKQRARMKVRYALRTGKIIRSKECNMCRVKCKTEAHHTDYSFPLDVHWLCRDCHSVV